MSDVTMSGPMGVCINDVKWHIWLSLTSHVDAIITLISQCIKSYNIACNIISLVPVSYYTSCITSNGKLCVRILWRMTLIR